MGVEDALISKKWTAPFLRLSSTLFHLVTVAVVTLPVLSVVYVDSCQKGYLALNVSLLTDGLLV